MTLDPHHEWTQPRHLDRWQALLDGVDVFLPSEEELLNLLAMGEPADDVTDYAAPMRRLARMGPEVVVVKVGARGAVYYHRESGVFGHVPALADEVVDVTGAGDAFCGGFCVGYHRTGEAATAARYGAVSAEAAVQVFGAAAAAQRDRSRVRQRLAEIKDLVTERVCTEEEL